MPEKPFGVWISVALAIALINAWLGLALGRTLATAWCRADPQLPGNLPNAERRHLEAELVDLQAAETLRALTLVTVHSGPQVRGSPALQIRRLEALARQAQTDEMRPVIALQVGVACTEQAALEERNHNAEGAAADMAVAESVARALGWTDATEETLKAVAENQIGPAYPGSQKPK